MRWTRSIVDLLLRVAWRNVTSHATWSIFDLTWSVSEQVKCMKTLFIAYIIIIVKKGDSTNLSQCLYSQILRHSYSKVHVPSYKQFIWDPSWKNKFMPYANNKGADQPAHPRSLISTFIVHCLDSIIPLLAIRSVRVAERLALPTSDHGVAGSNPAGSEILSESKRRFIAQSLSCSPFHRLEMTEILLKGRKTLTHPSIFLL